MSLLLIIQNPAGQSGKELSLNDVSMTNSTSLQTLSMITSLNEKQFLNTIVI